MIGELMDIKSPVQDASQALNTALQLHQGGKLDQAALHYAAILEAQPQHFDAMHLLGVVRSQQGRDAEALDKI